MSRVFGHIDGIGVGQTFSDRRELAAARVHKPIQAGISGSESEGCDSIVLSGGYEDDRDLGDTIVYTGHGGRDPLSGRQVSDQKLTRGNQALATSRVTGLPVRVSRGPDSASEFAPLDGYRYDGLYRVEDVWSETGKSGFLVWRFRPEAVEFALPPAGPEEQKLVPPPRETQTIQRIVRDTSLSRRVKHLYDFTCQVCDTRLEGPAGPYAEAAHIKPLGEPHNGPDVLENLLCLCPNHHVLFDMGAIRFDDELREISTGDRLKVVAKHKIEIEFVRYHRDHYGSR